MKKMPPKPAETPGIVQIALYINIALLIIAMIAPRGFATSKDEEAGAGAAVAFAIPMALILAIGAAAATRAYILARREDRPMRWTAFLPASMFLVGLGVTLALVYFQYY